MQPLSPTPEPEVQKKILELLLRDIDLATSARSRLDKTWTDAERQFYAEEVKEEETSKTNEGQDPKVRINKVPKSRLPEAYTEMVSRGAYLMSSLTSKEPILPMTATGPEDAMKAKAMEILDTWQFKQTDDESEIETAFTMMGIYGYFPCKVIFKEVKQSYEKVILRTPLSALANPMLATLDPENLAIPETVIEERLIQQFNQTIAKDPWHFWHDPRVPVARFHEGLFVIDEYRMERAVLQDSGQYYNLDKLDARPIELSGSSLFRDRQGATRADYTSVEDKTTVWVTDVWRRMSEKELKEVGLEGTPGIYLFTLAGRSNLISSRRNPYVDSHDDFPFVVFTDMPNTIDAYPPGVVTLGLPLFKDLDFLYNSHMEELQGVAIHQGIGNPRYIDLDLLAKNETRGIVPIRKDVYQEDGALDKAFKPIIWPFVTQGNILTGKTVRAQLRELTGATDPIIGQSADTREKTATETQLEYKSSGSKLDQLFRRQVRTGLRRWARLRTRNTVAYMSIEVAASVIGEVPEQLQAYADLKSNRVTITPQMIQGSNYDLLYVDGLKPMERRAQAKELASMSIQAFQDPEIRAVFDPVKIYETFLKALDFPSAAEFKRAVPFLPPAPGQGGPPMPGQGGPPTPQGEQK